MATSRPSTSARPTKYDVEMAKQRTAMLRLRNWSLAIRGSFWVLGVAAAALPLWVFGTTTIEPLAGETTNVNVNVALSIAATLSAAGNLFQFLKWKDQRSTIREQRDSLDTYEKKLLKEDEDAS